MIQALKKETTEKMETAIDHLRRELGSIRTGRASLVLLDGIKVDFYGSSMPLSQVATLSTPDSRSISIQPWDATLVPVIEKAILGSGLGLTPSHDGKILRISIPPLTEDRRKDLARLVKKVGEDSRVVVRNHRRDANEELKRLEKDGTLSKDDFRKAHDEIQKLTNQYMQKIDDILKHKETEILER